MFDKDFFTIIQYSLNLNFQYQYKPIPLKDAQGFLQS